MPEKVKTLEDLRRIKEEAQKAIRVRQDTGTKIIVGMGTCGIAAGARAVMKAILDELEKNKIEANVSTVGCIGMCAQEPLVDIEQGGARVTYGKVTPEKVPVIISEHLLKGKIVNEWVVGKASQREV
ncbi:MAG: (2Fe-2S) ferredoxin domain-containing protein [Chloroflexota bacterium]